MNDNDFELNTAPDGAPSNQPESTTPESASELIKPTAVATEPAEGTVSTEPVEPVLDTEATEPVVEPEAFPVPTHEEPAKTPKKSEPQNQTITIKQEAAKSSKPKKERRQKADKQPKPAPQPAVAPAVEAPKKRSRAKAVLIGLLLMLIAAAATWYIMSTLNSTETEDSNQVVEEEPAPASLTAKEIVDKIRADIAENLSEDYTDLAISSAVSDDSPSPSPAVKPDGADFFVVTLEAVGLEVSSATVAESSDSKDAKNFLKAVTDQAAATLGENDFEKANSPTNADNYQSDSVICSLAKSDNLPAFISCADLEAYTTAKTSLQPFAEAYGQSSSRDKIKDPAFTAPPEIKNSPDNQYQTASVAISSRDNTAAGQGLFWRPADGDWQYFTTTQSQLSCEAFDTEELRAAFAGEQCVPADDKAEPTTVGEL